MTAAHCAEVALARRAGDDAQVVHRARRGHGEGGVHPFAGSAVVDGADSKAVGAVLLPVGGVPGVARPVGQQPFPVFAVGAADFQVVAGGPGGAMPADFELMVADALHAQVGGRGRGRRRRDGGGRGEPGRPGGRRAHAGAVGVHRPQVVAVLPPAGQVVESNRRGGRASLSGTAVPGASSR